MTTLTNLYAPEGPVLIIDDCPMYRTATRGMLQKLGFDAQGIHLASDAKSALAFARANRPQLVICDYNLGKETDGHQLLDQLLHDNVLPADCVCIVVTADSSATVVRAFVELEPDGYLVKPLSFQKLQERLPKLSKRKRKLAKLLNSFAEEHHEQTLEFAEKAVLEANEQAFHAQQLKAKTLIKLKRYDEARNLLVTLKSGVQDQAPIVLELARLALLQKQYTLCDSTLQPLLNDPVHCASAAEVQCEMLALQQRWQDATEVIQTSIDRCAKNYRRHLRKALCLLACNRLSEAQAAMKQCLNHTQYSFRDHALYYQLLAVITLDQAQMTTGNERAELLKQFELLKKNWRKRFSRKQYKSFELLLQARAEICQGRSQNSRLLVEQFQQESLQSDHSAIVAGLPKRAIELMELAKVSLGLNGQAQYRALANDAQLLLQTNQSSFESSALVQYFSRWNAEIHQQLETFNALKKQGVAHISAGEFGKATDALVEARSINTSDKETPHLLMASLTKAWPTGWSKLQVERLAMNCRDSIIDTPYIRNPQYQRYAQRLAEQLSLPELIHTSLNQGATHDA